MTYPNIADAVLLLKDIVYGIIKILILIPVGRITHASLQGPP